MHLTNYHFYNPKNYLYIKPVKGLQSYGLGYGFAFNGKELDNETYGEGNAYDFGARIYDSRLGRWLSLDPLQAKYPHLSPYHFANNCPTYFIDPTGQSGVAYKLANINKATGRPILKVVSNVYLYGNDATKAIATTVSAELNSQYNNNGNYFTFTDKKGVTYDVMFEFTVKERDMKDLKNDIKDGDFEDNYFVVGEYGGPSYMAQLGGPEDGSNIGYLQTSDILKKGKTASHEMNHGLGGKDHPTDAGVNMQQDLDISIPTDTQYKDGSTINNEDRKVTRPNITSILEKVDFDIDTNTGPVGSSTRISYPTPQGKKPYEMIKP